MPENQLKKKQSKYCVSKFNGNERLWLKLALLHSLNILFAK